MDGQMVRRRTPAAMVDCPWCGRQVELDGDTIACRGCRIVVRIAPDPPPTARRTTPATIAA
jgi:DNA-directed RNA polymerase subunit RPC12/RpoP